MGLSASQARFLQLTARKSNVEYQTQQITFERLQLSQTLTDASTQYEDLTTNRKLVFSYNDGTSTNSVDITYTNYKNYMNQQGTTTSDQKYYLVSSSGNKIIVSSEADMQAMIEASAYTVSEQVESGTDEEGNTTYETQSTTCYKFSQDDFMIVDGLDDTDTFQNAIQDGIYYFATLEEDEETGDYVFNTQSWETLGSGAITSVYDTSDDAEAEAAYTKIQNQVENYDKKLEMQLDQLESERSAIETEIESVSKVIDDNIESSFKVFS